MAFHIEPARLGAAIYYGSLRAAGITALQRRLRDAGLILCYHNVVGTGGEQTGDPGLHVPRDRFDRQMRWLASRYHVVPLRELVDRVVAGASLRSVAAITFDDGYAGVFEHALPVLATLGLPATVFLVSDAVGQSSGFWWDQPEIVEKITPDRRQRWLTELRGDAAAILTGHTTAPAHASPDSHRPAGWTTIRAWLGTGIEFGVHSATHRALPALSDRELEYEVVASRARLHQATGVWPDFFAYPYGLWDPRVRECVHRAGYRAGLTLDYGLNAAVSNPSALRRINVPAGISEPAFEVWAAGLRPSDLTHWRI